jgi:hypothetical protein
MRDRFPLLVVFGLLGLGAVGTFVMQGARRGDFADLRSTYRSSKNGSRALYLLLAQNGISVQRFEQKPDTLTEDVNLALLDVNVESDALPTGFLATMFFDGGIASNRPSDAGVLDKNAADAEALAKRNGLNGLMVSQLSESEVEAVLEFVKSGKRLLYLPSSGRSNALTEALNLFVSEPPKGLGIRTLVPSQPSPLTVDTERLESEITALVSAPLPAKTFLVDEQLGESVGVSMPLGAGEVIVIGAVELASNHALTRADNARFWVSIGRYLSRERPLAFDEFHHGFTGERSVGDFARRYGLQYAALQLLLGLLFWALSLRQFGRPLPVSEDARIGSVDSLLATSRLYREGGHHAHAARLIVAGLTADLASHFSLTPQSTPQQLITAMTAAGKEQWATALQRIVSSLTEHANDRQLIDIANQSVTLRRNILDAFSHRGAPSL